jgi:hypothetical protein
MSKLLVLRCFTHDAQGVLAAVHRLALVGIENFSDLFVCDCGIFRAGYERPFAGFANCGYRMAILDDSQSAFRHRILVSHSRVRVARPVETKRHHYRLLPILDLGLVAGILYVSKR